MKTLFFSACALLAAVAASAFDNTVVNDFWDTTGYVNGTTSSQSATLATTVDTRMKSVRATPPPATFSTYNGMLITIR